LFVDAFIGREVDTGSIVFGSFLAIATAFFITMTVYSFRRGRTSYANAHLDKYLFIFGSNQSAEYLYHHLSVVNPAEYTFISDAKQRKREACPFIVRNYLVTYLRSGLFIIYIPSILWVSYYGLRYEHIITYYTIDIYTRISCGGRQICTFPSIPERLFNNLMKFLSECPVPIQKQINDPNDPYALPGKALRRTTEGSMLLEAECDKRFPHFYEQLRARFPE
jgi:hypothetical protein